MNDKLPDGSPWAARIDSARDMLREVNTLAVAGLNVTRLQQYPEDDTDSLQSRIRLLQLIIDRMGWVADVGLRHLGERGAFDRAEDWLLPGT